MKGCETAKTSWTRGKNIAAARTGADRGDSAHQKLVFDDDLINRLQHPCTAASCGDAQKESERPAGMYPTQTRCHVNDSKPYTFVQDLSL